MQKAKHSNLGIILGAAFLMATSAIGPGFQTQTTVFTQELVASFSFVILLVFLVDISTQLNTWRIITASKLRAQDIANKVIPGLGYFISALVVFGGLAFNIGNIAGCGMGINVVSGLKPEVGAVASAVIAIGVFLNKNSAGIMDNFIKVLGVAMILVTGYVAFASNPPVMSAIQHAVNPEKINFIAIVTLVGGSVGGYISFVGGHRLLDAGVKGPENLGIVNRSLFSGIAITGTMRIMLFLAALGVVVSGASLDPSNPSASVFLHAAGKAGYIFFGIVLWSASISSVIGAAYTSVSFMKTFHPWFEKWEKVLTCVVIFISAVIFLLLGNPVKLLLAAGALNGLILPVTLSVMLAATHKKSIMGDYNHPVWMRIIGGLVVIVIGGMSIAALTM
jgi:Mn2+/Fe2+ NRAMP family transporter